MSSSSMQRYVVGGDLGGTRFRVALADESGRFLFRDSVLTEVQQGREAILGRMVSLLKRAVALSPAAVSAITIAAPGPLDPFKGIIHKAPNIPHFENISLTDIIGGALGIPTHLNNDCNLGALGEAKFGAGQGLGCLVYITVSTGVGGGVIDHGQMLLGATGAAAEVGHMTIDMNGPVCGCGNRGCLESFASGTGIRNQAVAALRGGARSSLLDLVGGDVDRVRAETVVEAARAGDPLASDLMRRAGYALGVGVANVMHLYDPDLIALGGGVTNAGELLFAPMREAIEERAMAYYRQRIRVVPSALGDDVGLYGAVAHALAQQ